MQNMKDEGRIAKEWLWSSKIHLIQIQEVKGIGNERNYIWGSNVSPFWIQEGNIYAEFMTICHGVDFLLCFEILIFMITLIGNFLESLPLLSFLFIYLFMYLCVSLELSESVALRLSLTSSQTYISEISS